MQDADTPHIFNPPQMRLDLPIGFRPNEILITFSQGDRALILNAGGANPNVLPNEDTLTQPMQDLNVEREARGETSAASREDNRKNPKIYFSSCWEHFKQENGDPFAAVRMAESKFRTENNGVPDNNLNAAGVAPVSPSSRQIGNENAAGVASPVSPSRTIWKENEDRLNQLKLEAYNSNPIYKELLDEKKFMFKYTATNKENSISVPVKEAKQNLKDLYTNSDTNCVLIFVSSYAKLPTSLKPEFDVTIEDGRPAIWIGKFLDEIDDQIKIVYLQKIGKLALELHHSLVKINRDINAQLKDFGTRLENVMKNQE